eukprot:1788827-Alexandrium_andersonii.AAC.1
MARISHDWLSWSSGWAWCSGGHLTRTAHPSSLRLPGVARAPGTAPEESRAQLGNVLGCTGEGGA